MRLIIYIGFINGLDMFQIVTDLYGKLLRNVYAICSIDKLYTYVINCGNITLARYYNKYMDVTLHLTDMGNRVFTIARVTVNEEECNIEMIHKILENMGLMKLYETGITY